ncbi:alpha/beta hydrolase [Pelagicoccus sp. SDUM812002]|uniref:alpha/beta hydrolase n=1 Tax=Pelagicoccus sp. SDUM812002 TaxID=3041266 RepID=UPI0028109AEB|nr:alpha/beta hydrolase [Pelagicoccus sp. SDUM812002]MDQ8185826.1 alpha/beta hydrolase [Pelagicoccus sp. SDUM812002]
MKHIYTFITLLCLATFTVRAQEVIPLYPGEIPNSKVSDIQEPEDNMSEELIRVSVTPTLQLFLPEKESATGQAVVICPGGGYSVIVYQGEGVSTAKQLAANGIAAFVLKYRLPRDETMVDKKIGPLQDAQQAIKLVRENAEKWNIDPSKVGIMGFSAGGHLASTEATHFDTSHIENIEGTSLRPDFQILVYPVISMQDELTHADSRRKLLGDNPSQEDIDLYSNELQIKENAPPAYIIHAGDDALVDVDNSIEYFQKLRKLGIPTELHVYPKGGHGFIFQQEGWVEPLLNWMRSLD